MSDIILIIRKLADPTYYEKGYYEQVFLKFWILRPKTISCLVTAPDSLFFQNSI
jgi:hypothetical protein